MISEYEWIGIAVTLILKSFRAGPYRRKEHVVRKSFKKQQSTIKHANLTNF